MANNFPTIIPSLNLQFSNTGVLPPDVTFTRASQSGGYYDGRTVVKAEENLLLQSQTFDVSAYWQTASNVTITANSAVAPDGTTTADTMTEAATTATHRVSAANNLGVLTDTNTSARIFVLSCFYKVSAGTPFARLAITNSTGANAINAWFNLSAGTLGSTSAVGSATLTLSSITAVGSDWYRCVLIGSINAGTGIFPFIGMADADLSQSYAGDVGRSVFIWGAQLEQRSTVTAYTPTTTEPITNYIPKMLFAPANVPVFDHNPVTGEALGLSVWETRTNLLTYSDDFSNVAWTKTNTSILSNVIIAPDGTLTGDKLVESLDVGSTEHRINGAATTTAVSTTLSVFAKKAERNWMYLRFINSAGTAQRAWFNLDTGVVGARDSGSSTIQHVGNGWYRCTFTLTAFAGGNALRVYTAEADNDLDYIGNGTSGIYIWGAQLEAGAFATPYIPTVGSTVARSADVAVMTGVNFSRWFNAGQGALVVEGRRDATSNVFPNLAAISDGTGNNRIMVSIYSSNNSPFFDVVTGNVAQCSLSKPNVGAGVFAKIAGSYQTNNFAMTANGASVETDTLGTIPVVNQLRIGSNSTGTVDLNGYIRSLSYYPIALTSAQLQAITG